MENTGRIADEWRIYAGSVLPRDMDDVRRDDARRTFYAGAWAIVAILTHEIAETEPLRVEPVLAGLLAESGEFLLKELKNEVDAMSKSMRKRAMGIVQ